jgi:hypothetical protein
MRALAAILFGSSLFAADLSGVWIGQIPTRNNDMLDVAFKIVQTGTEISGKLYGEYQSSRIVEGKVTGDQVNFVVLAAEQAGNQINETRLRFSGTINNGEMELTLEREGSKSAGNGGGTEFRGNNKQAFKLKRLL